jgi:hypothetical protein
MSPPSLPFLLTRLSQPFGRKLIAKEKMNVGYGSDLGWAKMEEGCFFILVSE